MKLGVQSFTMRDDFKRDFYGTLKKVSDLGLHYVEWLAVVTEEDHGLGLGFTPQEAVRIFDDYGMKLTGCIFKSENPRELVFNFDEVQKIIDWYSEAGCTAIGLTNDYFVDEEFFNRRMDAYNELGRRCKEAGMVWTYHNHFHEQQKLNGKPVLDLMIERLDPDYVGFDWDVYWGVRGLVDPVENIKRLGNRIKRFHCKDFPFNRLDHINIAKDLPEELICWDNKEKFSAYKMVVPEDFIECGKGIIKWQEVINAANEFNIPYMFVEQDHTTYPDKFESLAVSRDYLLGLNGLEIK